MKDGATFDDIKTGSNSSSRNREVYCSKCGEIKKFENGTNYCSLNSGKRHTWTAV